MRDRTGFGRGVFAAGLAIVRSAIGVLGRTGAVLLLATVLADAVLRFTVNQPIAGTIEYVSFWYMVAIAFFGLSIAERDREHIDAPLVFDRLPAPIQREFDVIARVLFVVVLAAMAWWGLEEAVRQQAFGARGGAAGVPTWPTRYFVPVGAAACALEVAVGMFTPRRQPDDRSPDEAPGGLGAGRLA